MAKFDQANRLLKIQTDLPDSQVGVTSLHGQEAINELFSYQANVFSENLDIDGKAFIGSNVTLSIHKDDKKLRFVNGYVVRISKQNVSDRNRREYQLTLAPWFYFLSKRQNCRIFQAKTVIQIAEEIFAEYSQANFTFAITAKPPEREYTVQYNESDASFISRLFAEEGINFHFEHDNGKHVMVISDSNKSFKPADEKNIAYHSGSLEEDHIHLWQREQSYVSGHIATDSYDFTTPNKPLNSTSASLVKLTQNEQSEIYEYYGEYNDKNAGQTRMKRRLEAEEANYDNVAASSNCRSLQAGQQFTLDEHDAKAELGDYIITAINVSAMEPSLHDQPDASSRYQNEFICQPASTTVRPQPSVQKPTLVGSHRAVVVGPKGEEIYVDKFGRIKVQFKWDRYRNGDDGDSCWLRVNQQWSGNGFGAQFIPRVGTEVIIDFFQGDIDQPYVQGCLYNGEQKLPFELPANKTQSGIKTLSSKDGDGFNALRFEDKKGEEEVFIHGEKDYRKIIRNDAFEEVGNNAERHVANNQTTKVDENQHVTIGQNSTLNVNQDLHETVVGDRKAKVDGTYSTVVKGDTLEECQSNFSNETTNKYSVKAKNIVLEAADKLTLRVGGSEVVLTKKEIHITSASLIKQKAAKIKLN